MKEVGIDYATFKSLVSSKGLLPQYYISGDSYQLFAVEANVSWSACVARDGGADVVDFESIMDTFNRPLEYRSSDGLLKTASAKFVDTLTLYVDGENGYIAVSAGQVGYLKSHYTFPYTLSGVDISWEDATSGDYVDFEVGFYTGATENDFYVLQHFGNKYRLKGGTGSRLFDVPTVKTIPSTVTVNGNTLDIYIRTRVTSTGSTDLKVCVNLVGWK